MFALSSEVEDHCDLSTLFLDTRGTRRRRSRRSRRRRIPVFLRLSKQNSPKLANSSAHPPPFTFTCSCLRIDRGGFVTQTRLHFVFVILPKPSNELRKKAFNLACLKKAPQSSERRLERVHFLQVVSLSLPCPTDKIGGLTPSLSPFVCEPIFLFERAPPLMTR